MKIKKEELKTIQEQQDKTNSILNEIGYIESRKHGLLHELASVNQEVEEYKKVLEEKYGAININLEDGVYTEIKEEEEEETPVAAV
jgi:GTPase involved in cell partitioning and DNA repair